MSRIFRPYYQKLYPGTEDHIVEDMKKSDRKMEYQEKDRKQSRIRKDKNGNVIELESLECSYDGLSDTGFHFASCRSAEDDFFAELKKREFYQILDTLSDRDRIILEEHIWDGHTFSEIKEAYNIPISTAARRAVVIKEKLRKLLAHLKNAS